MIPENDTHKVNVLNEESMTDTDLNASLLDLLGIETRIETEETSRFDPKSRWSGGDYYTTDVIFYYRKSNNEWLEELSSYGSDFCNNEMALAHLLAMVCDHYEDEEEKDCKCLIRFGLQKEWLREALKNYDISKFSPEEIFDKGMCVLMREKAEAAYRCLSTYKSKTN